MCYEFECGNVIIQENGSCPTWGYKRMARNGLVLVLYILLLQHMLACSNVLIPSNHIAGIIYMLPTDHITPCSLYGPFPS